jgi:hypothetical protein
MARRLVATAVVSMGLAAGAALGTGVADAAGPIALESCSAHVVNEPGQQITLRPTAVSSPIEAALAPLDPLDPLGVIRPLFRQVWSTVAPIPIGTIPAAGQVVIPGEAVANAVAAQLMAVPVLAPVLDPLLSTVWTTIAQACSVVGEAVAGAAGTQPAPAPGQPAPGQPAPGQPPAKVPSPTATGGLAPRTGGGAAGGVSPESPATATSTGAPPGSNTALEYPVEWRNVAPGVGLPPEGVAIKLPALPGGTASAPQFGVLGGGDPAAARNQQMTGSVEALSAQPSQAVRGPVVLAVLLLTLVAAQWGRRWILRRTDAAEGGGARFGLRWRQLRVPLPVVERRKGKG